MNWFEIVRDDRTNMTQCEEAEMENHVQEGSPHGSSSIHNILWPLNFAKLQVQSQILPLSNFPSFYHETDREIKDGPNYVE